jgi:diguanylate cyclase (GGDEF)-like protein/PAS domain S-box-containing protein
MKSRSHFEEDSASSQTLLIATEDQLDSLSNEKTRPENEWSERQQIKQALISSEVRYRRLFETAKDGILLLDAETGQIADVNPFLQELLGYSHTELLGRTLWEIGPFKDVAASQSAFRQLQSQEYVRYENLPLETKNGQHRQVEFVSNVYLVDGQRVIQCNIRDITARKQTEVELRKANEDLVALVAGLKKRDQEMQLLNRMNDLLQACTTKVEAYQVITLIAGGLFVDQTGCLAILHPKDQHFAVVARWGSEGPVEMVFSWEDCWAMRRGQLHEVVDPQAGLLCSHFIHPPETGYLCVPLMVQGETLGVLCLLGGERKGEHFVAQQLAVAMGEGIKLALSNIELREELREEALHDPLTGLYNRRYLEDSLARELYRAQRQNTSLCVSMLDIDHFKQMNDTFGHGAGDALLRELGRILHENLRMSDIACRYGGDEFLLILPDSSLDDTRYRMQQILELVKELRLWHGDQLLESLTVSAGVAVAHEHNFNGREILRAADEALYAAKQAGRDLVVTNTGGIEFRGRTSPQLQF